MKKKCIFLLLLVLGVSPILAAPCGDVNSDGSINIIDALMIAQHYVGLTPSGFDSGAADVSGDGAVNIIDALQVAQYYVGLITSFEGCTTTPEPTPAPTSEIVFAVNCGGGAYTGSDGTKYLADTGYTGGSAYENGASVSGTVDEALYQTERFGTSTYSASVPNGEYLVTFHFAENYHTAAGLRSFNVLLEGTKVLSDLDIYKVAGANSAYVTEHRVAVSDLKIDIQFVTLTENALINAIKVTALSYTGEPIVDFSVSPPYARPGETITVDASDSFDPNGVITNYMVDYGDGYTASGAVTSHQYQREGTYTITVTVTDNEGESSIGQGSVLILEELPQCNETRPDSPPMGSLKKVDRATWGANGVPTNVTMNIYVPGLPSKKPAVVMSCHSCGNNAAGQVNNNRNIVNAADKYGFIMIFPETDNKRCWEHGTTQALTRDGGGQTQALAQMIQYVLKEYNADKDRVYIMGGSSGAMMTQSMLAVYPDLFQAGSARAGVPAGCSWSGSCGSSSTKTPEEWGNLVRGINPDYNGPRPRVLLFHGMSDTTIPYFNMVEAIKEWSNVLGLSQTPTLEDTISPPDAHYNYNRQFWKNECDFITLEAWSSPGNGHSMKYEEEAILKFFGLDAFRCIDPQVTACSN